MSCFEENKKWGKKNTIINIRRVCTSGKEQYLVIPTSPWRITSHFFPFAMMDYVFLSSAFLSKGCVIIRVARCNTVQVGMNEKCTHNSKKCTSQQWLGCHAASAVLSTAQGLQRRCLYQQMLEVRKYPNSDDNGGCFFSTCGCWLSVLQAMRWLRSLEHVFPVVITSISLKTVSTSICSSIMASP